MKWWKVTLSNTDIVQAETKEEAIKDVKFSKNYWHEDGTLWHWDKETAIELKEGDEEK